MGDVSLSNGWWAVLRPDGEPIAMFRNRRQADAWGRSWAVASGHNEDPRTVPVQVGISGDSSSG